MICQPSNKRGLTSKQPEHRRRAPLSRRLAGNLANHDFPRPVGGPVNQTGTSVWSDVAIHASWAVHSYFTFARCPFSPEAGNILKPFSTCPRAVPFQCSWPHLGRPEDRYALRHGYPNHTSQKHTSLSAALSGPFCSPLHPFLPSHTSLSSLPTLLPRPPSWALPGPLLGAFWASWALRGITHRICQYVFLQERGDFYL